MEPKTHSVRLILEEVRLRIFLKCNHSSHKIQRIIRKCLVKINIAILTATLNKGVKAKMSVLSVTSQQCTNCNSTISQEKSLGIELHRQSAPKMDKLKKTIGSL